MKKLVDLFLYRRYRPLCICYRYVSIVPNNKYEGIREKIDEKEARRYFDKWLKSLRFAPGGWTESTRNKAITVTRRYLPFWNVSLHGSINASIEVTELLYKSSNVPTYKWHSVPIMISSASLNDINIYAAQTLDRYHLNELHISFDNNQIINLNNEENDTEQWTVDKDTAFHIGWDLNIIPHLIQSCIQATKQAYYKYHNYRVESFHFDINSKTQRLLYYPIYIINYKYDSLFNFTCFVDGVTGKVAGDRQYSMIKVTLATLVAFYPLPLIGLISLCSLINPAIGVALTSVSSLKSFLLINFNVGPLVGFYAKIYPKLYRQRIKRQQWQNYRTNESQFTYDFTTPFQQKYQSFKQQQQRTSESTSRRKVEIPINLYNLLSVHQRVNEKEIRRAYLIKAKELHPDRNPEDKTAEELFKKVNQAYTILSDKYKRRQYDRYGYESVKYN